MIQFNIIYECQQIHNEALVVNGLKYDLPLSQQIWRECISTYIGMISLRYLMRTVPVRSMIYSPTAPVDDIHINFPEVVYVGKCPPATTLLKYPSCWRATIQWVGGNHASWYYKGTVAEERVPRHVGCRHNSTLSLLFGFANNHGTKVRRIRTAMDRLSRDQLWNITFLVPDAENRQHHRWDRRMYSIFLVLTCAKESYTFLKGMSIRHLLHS